MPDISTFVVVALASLALSLAPGPAVLYIVARGVEGGRAAGFVSVLGITTGGLVHILFAAVGISAILASSAAAFNVVKWLGVAYLVWLGLSRIFGGEEEHAPAGVERKSLPGVFLQGVIVDVLNPKVALFFLAFLPQFVDPALGAAWLQILLLGLTFSVVGLCTDSLYALLSGTAGNWIRRKSRSMNFRRGQRYITGGVYLTLGAAAAMSGPGKN